MLRFEYGQWNRSKRLNFLPNSEDLLKKVDRIDKIVDRIENHSNFARDQSRERLISDPKIQKLTTEIVYIGVSVF